jgi:hypothetical protein
LKTHAHNSCSYFSKIIQVRHTHKTLLKTAWGKMRNGSRKSEKRASNNSNKTKINGDNML